MNSYDDKNIQRIIDAHIKKYVGTDIPESVLRSKAKIIVAETMRSYDPAKGDFNSLLNKNLLSLNRFAGSSMQIRIPEYKQQKLKTVMDTINREYGEDNENIDFKHIGKLLHMKPENIRSIYTSAKRTVVSDPAVEEYAEVQKTMPNTLEMNEIYKNLPSDRHKEIFCYSFGWNGYPELKTNAQIAGKMGISESYVRKMKDDILKMVK